MTLLHLQTPVNPWQLDVPFRPGPAGALPTRAADAPSPPGALLRFQLNRLIDEVLVQPGLDPDTRISLQVHAAESPGRPAHALLAHLRDILDPEDLPPYKA